MRIGFFLLCLTLAAGLKAGIVFDGTSPYHHIRVIDERGIRVLSFDGSLETRMSLLDPSKGHFEYTEFFHMPLLWNTNITNVLMIGLGGASTQRAYQRYYPKAAVESVELDPMVVNIAKRFFFFKETPTNKVTVADGRVFLRRAQDQRYDLILMDAYVKSRYGSFIPYHLVTKEFFQIAHDKLSTNGLVAYNVIGSLQGWRADILGSVYKTMQSVFPQVCLFPATDSLNVVLVASKTHQPLTLPMAAQRALELSRSGVTTLPAFQVRARALRTEPPPSFARSPCSRMILRQWMACCEAGS